MPKLGDNQVVKEEGEVSNTITDDDGIDEFTFTTLDGFEVIDVSPSTNFAISDSDGDGNDDTWTWTGSGSRPTSVDFTLDATQSTASYFVEVTDACATGAKTAEFDPRFELGPNITQARLAGPAPNPFSGQTTVEFALPEQMRVTVSVYDMMGRKVATLVDGMRSGGSHTVSWNGRTDGGQDLASGVYLMRMTAEDRSMIRRVTVVR